MSDAEPNITEELAQALEGLLEGETVIFEAVHKCGVFVTVDKLRAARLALAGYRGHVLAKEFLGALEDYKAGGGQ